MAIFSQSSQIAAAFTVEYGPSLPESAAPPIATKGVLGVPGHVFQQLRGASDGLPFAAFVYMASSTYAFRPGKLSDSKKPCIVGIWAIRCAVPVSGR